MIIDKFQAKIVERYQCEDAKLLGQPWNQKFLVDNVTLFGVQDPKEEFKDPEFNTVPMAAFKLKGGPHDGRSCWVWNDHDDIRIVLRDDNNYISEEEAINDSYQINLPLRYCLACEGRVLYREGKQTFKPDDAVWLRCASGHKWPSPITYEYVGIPDPKKAEEQ